MNNALVVKHNDLIPAMSKFKLQELRFLAFCLSRIDAFNDTKFSEIEADVQDISDVFGITTKSIYEVVRETAIAINSKPAEYKEKDDLVIAFWFSTIRYREGLGRFKFRFNDALKEKLLDLKENYTGYRIKDIYQFRSETTWHVYEILRQHKKIGKKEFSLEEFKELIGVSGLYARFNNLNFRILIPSIEEINAVSDIKVEYEKITHFRKVVGLLFFITNNTDNMTPTEKLRESLSRGKTPSNNPEFARVLREEFHMAPKQAKQLANLVDHNGQEPAVRALLPKLRKRYEALENKKTPLGGYVFRALREELTQGKLTAE